MVLEYLLRHWRRTGDADALRMVETTLVKMANGGIYDQAGGGFHRYSVDAKWLVPHFEKMLYDNALLSRIYIHAYQATGKGLYKRIACETLDYVIREMKDENGGFYSTQDADSDDAEGKYYVWTPDEIIEVLGKDDGELFCKYFDVSARGNFEGRSILNVAFDEQELAGQLSIDPAELSSRMQRSKNMLLEKRSHRTAPHRDDKMLASWNGLMLASLAEAAMVFDRQDYLEAAVNNAKFLTEVMYKDGWVSHSYKDGRSTDQGFLQDYAFICDGLIRLHAASFDRHWLTVAMKLADEMIDQFREEDKRSFYDTRKDQNDLLVRPRNIYDNALPSGSSAAAMVLLSLLRLADTGRYEYKALLSMEQALPLAAQYPLGFGNWLCAIDFYLSKPKELVLAGYANDEQTKPLVGIIAGRYLPNVVQARVDPGSAGLDIPLPKDRAMIDGKPTMYICEEYTCKAPVSDSSELESMLDELI